LRRARTFAIGLALSAVALGLVPADAASVPKVFQCTGDAWVTNYNFGDPVNDATGGFWIDNSTLFCHDEKGKSGYTGTVDVRVGTVEGSGWCADPAGTEPGNISIRADVEINITHEANGILGNKVLQHWKLFRTLTGSSDAPIPGGNIFGKVRLPGGVGRVGTFSIEPMGTPDDCYHQFESVRFHDLWAVQAPGL
jgi:hypothetical protein